MTRRFGGRRQPESAAEQIIESNMKGVYDMLERKGVRLDEGEKEQVRAFASGAVLDTIEAIEEEDEDDEITDEQAAALLVRGELDTTDLSEDDIAELMEYIPEELVPVMLENNGEDVDAVLGDDEDEEDDETEEDDDEYEGEYDEEEDEETEEDDDEEEEDGRAFYNGGVNRGYNGQVNIDALVRDAYRRGRAETMSEVEGLLEQRDEAQSRAFALGEEMQENEEFIIQLARNGQLPPHLIEPATAMLNAGSSVTDQTRSFAAADMGEYGNATMSELTRFVLSNLPRNSSFADVMAEPDASDVRAFTAHEFAQVGKNNAISEEINRAVLGIQNEYAAKGQRISYEDAFNALQDASRKNG